MNLCNFNISSQKKTYFENRGITRTEELVRILPKDYISLIPEQNIRSEKEYSCILATVKKVALLEGKCKGVKATCVFNNNIYINVFWFNQDYLYEQILALKRREVVICGKFKYDTRWGYSVSTPIVFEKQSKIVTSIFAKYNYTGSSDEYMSNVMESILTKTDMKEYIPETILNKRKLPDIKEALYSIHFPDTANEIKTGLKRLLYDELFFFAAKQKIAAELTSKTSPFIITKTEIMNRAINAFKYPLTSDQKKAVNAIIDDMMQGKRVKGLVQGDVGCGKTIVAFLVAIALAENGYQTVIMAPSRVVAQQHFKDLQELVSDFDIKCGLLISKMKKKETESIKNNLKEGKIKIVVGTSSLLSYKIEYKNLACVIVDEEHKFGVIQRDILTQRGEKGVHTISMSATPIPRTLATTIYDDTMELYNINELPAGRLRTLNCITDEQDKVFDFCRKRVSEGKQIYIVCPMIEKDENLASTEDIAELYKMALPKLKISVLTGKTKQKEFENIINDFKEHKSDILVATSVIEVGVNIPNATSIIIHNAERFGLASLHQLRGRVGRGLDQGYCILFSDRQYNHRLQIISNTNDGFAIAAEDLMHRQTGELLGTKQSGKNDYINLLLKHPDIFYEAKEDVNFLYENYAGFDEIIKTMQCFLKEENM